MGSVSGVGTNYGLPNYTGDLYQISPTETPLVSAIGGLSLQGLSNGQNDGRTTSTEFEWSTVDIRTTSASNTKVEGAAAPTANSQSRSNVTNVVEIHQSKVSVAYSKMAAIGQKAGSNNDLPSNVTNEVDFQIGQELRAIAVDIEKSFTTGTYQKPANNSTARQTRGLRTAITTNLAANGGTGRALTKALFDGLLTTMHGNGAIFDETVVVIAGAAQKVNLSNIYSAATLNQPTQTRNVGGVAVDTLVTDFGVLGVMLDRWWPTGELAVVNLGVCEPVWLDIPGKGHGLFAEPLGLVGSSVDYQLYGEVGLEYGPEQYHGVLDDLN